MSKKGMKPDGTTQFMQGLSKAQSMELKTGQAALNHFKSNNVMVVES